MYHSCKAKIKLYREIVYKTKNIFEKFINILYEKKSQPNIDSNEKNFYKLLMNSAYGKFG